jgi:hypothetical protein
VHLAGAADQHGDQRPGQVPVAIRKARRLGGQAGLGHPVQATVGDDHVGRGQPVVARSDHHIEVRRVDRRVLHLNREGAAAALSTDGHRHGHGLPAAGDQHIRPRRGQGIAARIGAGQRPADQQRRQPAPRLAHADALDEGI